MAVKLSPVFQEATLDTNGNPWSGAHVHTYVAGSSTPVTTYQDSGGLTQHTNPIILDARGEPPAPIWITSGVMVKFVLASPTDTTPPVSAIRTVDNVSGINDTAVTLDQWVAGPTPTYVSATSFTLVGDQTSTFHVGRRLKTTNSGGTVYSRISVSAFGALTTITVVNDSGTLDSGLSAVSYGILSATNPSIPIMGLLTNSLTGDVSLSNTGLYFDGPVVAQGTAGTWYVSGTVTVLDTAGGAQFIGKLWDGTTVIASGKCSSTALNQTQALALSGYITKPVGNLRISVNDLTATSGKVLFNNSGLSMDSTITAIRIA